jgi:hypothetical protein
LRYATVDKVFAGPTAVVGDSNANFVKGNLVRADRVDFFVMTRAEGKQTGNAISATSILNEGRVFSLKVQEFERRVPIRPIGFCWRVGCMKNSAMIGDLACG